MKSLCVAGQQQLRRRSGVAAAEFAACLPILVIIVIATIEACSMVYLKQSRSVAAYEGARAALRPGTDTADVNAACNQILTARNVKATTITITPADFETKLPQTCIIIRVATSGGDHSVVSGWSYDQLLIDGAATMMKEFE